MLDSYPGLDRCLSKTLASPTSFEGLFDASGALWPAGLRAKVDALFSDAPLADTMQAIENHLLTTPSPKSVFMWAVFTGQNRPPATPSDAAFSMTGKLYGGPWAMWDSPDMDAANVTWHERCTELLQPYVAGHYVAESDTVTHPEYAKLSFTLANWARLNDLRVKHDPDGLFFDFCDGLQDT
jgi:hypothetical protein